MPEVDVSVIVVNWNTAQITCDCLESIYYQTDGISFEVILIDNASSDNSVAMIKVKFPQVILIENDGNRGFAAANNQGIAIAKGRHVLLLNPDTIILDGAIQKTIIYADSHPQYAVVGCQVWEDDKKIQQTCFRFCNPWILFCNNVGLSKLFGRSKIFGGDGMLWWNRKTTREVDVVSGMFMLVNSDAVKQVGDLDESFFIYCEEMDWCYRFAKAGWKSVFWTGARIIHLDGGSKSSSLVSVKMEKQKIKSILIYIRKYFGLFAEIYCRLIVTLASLCKTVIVFIMLICVLFSKPKRTFYLNKLNKFRSITSYCILNR